LLVLTVPENYDCALDISHLVWLKKLGDDHVVDRFALADKEVKASTELPRLIAAARSSENFGLLHFMRFAGFENGR
jgi:hypothetical protein